MRLDTIKLLEDNIGRTLSDINCTYVFLSPKAKEIKTKINKWELIKITRFCTAKKTINKMKRQPTYWEKICANDTTNKALLLKHTAHIAQQQKNKQPNQKNGQKT